MVSRQIKTLWVLLILFIGLRVFLMWQMPLTDPSESRYATMGQQMCQTGDYVVPRYIHDGSLQIFAGKPPLFFQANGLCQKWLGSTAFAARLPSFLCALLVLGLIGFCVAKMRTREQGLLTMVLCCCSGAFYVYSGYCLTDMMLTASVCGGLLFAGCYLQYGGRWDLGVWVCLAIGSLTKGPVVFILLGLPLFIDACVHYRWKTWWRSHWVLGLGLFIILVTPWFILMAQRDDTFLHYFFINENFLRFVSKNYGDRYGGGHEFFYGAAAIWALLALLPWTPLAIWTALRKRCALFNEPISSLCTIGVLVIVGFWCLTTRIPFSYILPAIPLAVMVIGLHLPEEQRHRRLLAGMWLMVIVAIGSLVVFHFLGKYHAKMPEALYQRLKNEFPTRDYYFVQRTPYSANFTLGATQVIAHPDGEPIDVPLARPNKPLFIARKRAEMPRTHFKPCFTQNSWTVYEFVKE